MLRVIGRRARRRRALIEASRLKGAVGGAARQDTTRARINLK